MFFNVDDYYDPVRDNFQKDAIRDYGKLTIFYV